VSLIVKSWGVIHEGRDDLVAASTVILAAFTVVLAYATRRQTILTREIVNATLRSVDASEQNIALAFRPRLVVRRISLDKWDIGHPGEIQFIVADIGVSPGKIVESNATIHVLRQGTLPAIPPYNESTDTMGAFTVDTGPGYPAKAETVFPITPADYDRVFGAPRGRLYLFGYIVYDGDAGRQHMAFGREYDNTTKRFHIVDDPNYEYGSE
jgi:hypothetical protein